MRRIVCFLVLAALGASACAPEVSAAEIIAKSPAALIEKRTSKIAMIMDFSITASGQDFAFRMEGEGEQDYAGRKAHVVFSLVGKDVPQLAPQETIFDGDFAYSKAPCALGPLVGKTWVKIDPRQATGVDPSSVASKDPTGLFEGLRGAKDIEKVGIEKVRGVSATHYKMKIDPKEALNKLTPERREQVRTLFGSLGPEIAADAWIDKDGLPRKYSFPIESGADSPTAFKIKITFEAFDFGTQVEVPIPPDDQVYLATDLQALAAICAPANPPKS